MNTPFYIPGEKPNAWIRIKGNIIETSKQIKIGIAEARKLWRAVSAMHRGAEFRHGLVEDITGHYILEEGLEDWDEDDYRFYGLPLFKATAVKYGWDNPIGEDSGRERKYDSQY